jgi:hypothetical protein
VLASAKQSDVTDVGDALNEWISRTQVPMPTCGRRLPGLIWALTMFDYRVTGALP